MESNPYQAPMTPSDQITQTPEVHKKPSTAYRVGEVFYCEPDFESPNVFFKTGVPVPETVATSKLWNKSTCFSLYFDRGYKKQLSNKQLSRVIFVFFIAILSIYLAMIFSSVLFIIPVIIIFLFTLKPAKVKSIQITALADGFFAIKGGHSGFLKSFSDRS